MRTKKRIISKLFKVLLLIFVSVLTVIIASKIMFTKMQNEQKMISSYEIKKEKCELLKDIAKESIQEGVGINTKKIPSDKIQYRIYNDNENIIFYYYLRDDSTAKHKYEATITMSNEYKILNEEYSIEMETLDEYIKAYNVVNRFLSVMLSIMLVYCIYILIFIILLLLKVCVDIKRKKQQ